MNPISNYHHYRHEMSKGLQDKLFFIEHIVFDNLLDYGCADGSLIEIMSKEYGDINYFGYDFDPDMINFANAKEIPSSCFSNNLDYINNIIQGFDGKTAVLCSSLIHEVYSYSNKQSVLNFWNNLFSGQYDYVVIRDMALKQSVLKQKTSLSDLEKVKNKANTKQLDAFQFVWGDIGEQQNFIHFLMKYRYVQNWDRELIENYFPITIEDYLKIIPEYFEVIHEDHSLLPFLKNQVYTDFGVKLKHNTHIKLILKKK